MQDHRPEECADEHGRPDQDEGAFRRQPAQTDGSPAHEVSSSRTERRKARAHKHLVRSQHHGADHDVRPDHACQRRRNQCEYCDLNEHAGRDDPGVAALAA